MTVGNAHPFESRVAKNCANDLECTRRQARWVLVATIIGSSIAFIDGTAVNIALPVLQSEMNASLSSLQWVVESYTLTLAALMMVGGSLGDRLGRRKVFALGIVGFAAASGWCGVAPSMGQLIVARAAQGVGGALLVPGSLALLSAAHPPETRGAAIGAWSGFTAINAALGPVLGGWLIENYSWRWVFYINVPLAILVLAIIFLRVPESRKQAAGEPLDWLGALLAAVGLGVLIWGLIEANRLGLMHRTVLTALAVGFAALAGFLVVERRSRAPMMPLFLFRSRSFNSANLLTLMIYAGLSGAIFFLPFNLIQVQGYSIMESGAAMLPLILMIFLLSKAAGGLVDRFGPKIPLVIGPLIVAAGYTLFALPSIGGSYWVTFFPAVVVLGLGLAVCVAPLTTVVMSAVDENHSGIASGINNAISRTAGLLAIALMGLLAVTVFGDAMQARMLALDIAPGIREVFSAEHVRLASADIPAAVQGAQRQMLQTAVTESFVSAFRSVMAITAVLALAGSLIALLWVDNSPPRPAAEIS